MEKNENRINFFIVIAVIILVAGVALFLLKDNFKTNYVTSISLDELKEKIKNKESFILVFTQDTCSHCKEYLPKLSRIGKEYNLTFYDLSTTKLNSEEKNYIKNISNYDGTPTTVFIENGEEKSSTTRIEGNVSEARIIERLKAMGYISESNE